jgi:hypothetical protein
MRIVLSLAVVLFALGLGRVAGAQSLEAPRARQGYWVAFGYGPQVEKASLKGDSLTLSGAGGSIRLGQMLTPRYGLGVRIDFDGGKGDGYDGGGGGLMLEGQANLWKQLNLHAGFGFAFASLQQQEAAEKVTEGGYGGAALLAVSYDFFFTHRTSGGWAVTPALTARALSGGDVDAVWVTLGVQISWWSGRPRNELDLPEGAAYQ